MGAWAYQIWSQKLAPHIQVSRTDAVVYAWILSCTSSLSSDACKQQIQCLCTQVLPVELPGHGSRMAEPRVTDLCSLACQIVDALGSSFQ